MTPEQLAAEIAKLESAIGRRVAGEDAVRVKEGDRDTEFARVSLADMRARLPELQAQLAGTPARQPRRLVLF